jgi:thiamine-monophosphate kinase
MTDGAAPDSGEFGRIRRFFRPLSDGFPGALGLTNDAAVFGVPSDRELVVTTDGMVGEVHFLSTDPPGDIAAKLLRVNLSDLAAMGADPLAYTLVTALPKGLGDDWLAAFAAGLEADQRRYGIGLAGGDSVSTAGPMSFTVTAFGLVPRGQALPRSGGRPGDRVFVTGTIGDAALGLGVSFGTLTAGSDGDRAFLLSRLRRPEPRLGVGAGLRGLASAGLDVSDGLIADLAHIAEESGCRAEVAAARVPVSGAARAVLAAGAATIETLITGGDDYELLFTAPVDRVPAIQTLARSTGVPIVEIGRLTEGETGRVVALDETGAPLPLEKRGWVHF